MPIFRQSVTGIDDLKQLLLRLDGQLKSASLPVRRTPSHIIFVFFTDSKLPDGLNWCEECARVEPSVDMAIDRLDSQLGIDDTVHWVTCHVGARDYWYNPNNPFRRDPQLRLYSIPALLGMYRKGGQWADDSAELSQIYEKEEYFVNAKAVENTVLDFVDLANRFGNPE